MLDAYSLGTIIGRIAGVAIVAAVVTYLLDLKFKFRNQGRAFGVAFLVAGLISLPGALRQIREQEVDTLLRTDAFYIRILADHPELRASLREGLLKALESPDTGRAVGDLTIRLIVPVLPEYVPRASDAALQQFASTLTTTLKTLQKDGRRCYSYLFPTPGHSIVLTSQEGAKENMAALRAAVSTASSKAPLIPTEEAVGPSLQKIILPLVAKYGEDIALLDPSGVPNVDHAKVCALFIDVWDGVLRLPEEERGPVTRFLMSQQQGAH